MLASQRCGYYIEGGDQDRSLWNTFHEEWYPIYSNLGDMSVAVVYDKLHDHFDHVPVWQQTQNLAGEAAMP